jgi:hypothetical protein
MPVTQNRRGFDHAKNLVGNRKCVLDERDEWSEHQPSAAQENAFIERYGFEEYALWHLGIDDSKAPDTKGRYKFPYGDFKKVHRCGVLAAESRAGQRKYIEIELAAAHLHGMLDAMMARRRTTAGRS